jgi:hypothetical protein
MMLGVRYHRDMATVMAGGGAERWRTVDRPGVDVMFVETDDTPASISAAWAQLERILGCCLQGRRFLGTFWPGTSYRASAEIREGDIPDVLGLDRSVVPGGTYLSVRLRGEPPQLYARIPDAFGRLQAVAARDGTRPCIEWYRRRDEVDLLMPVAASV